VGEFAGGGQRDAVQGAFARAVGKVADGMVAGQADDPSGSLGAAKAPPVFADQQPGGARVDGEVPVEAFNGGVEDA
jgi:hypothetical protein